MPKQSFGTPQIQGNTPAELRQSVQFWFQQVYNHLDRMSGLRGTPTIYADLDANGMTITNVRDAQNPTDLVPKKQTLTLTMNPENSMMQFDAQGIGIFNGSPGDHPADLVTLQQLRDELAAGLSVGGLGASFVTVNTEPLLPNERSVAVQPGVLLLTDGGAGSTLTWSVVNNGIGDTQLRQGAATSLVGRSANSIGNLADIAASANGQVLRRAANALSFGPVDLTDGTNAVTGALAIANGGTGQTAQTAAFNALDPLTTKGDVIAHDGTNSIRVAVGTNGQLLVADSAATPGLAWKGTVQAYTPTNVTTDRAFDADTVVVAELADVVGTLINDLKTFGILT